MADRPQALFDGDPDHNPAPDDPGYGDWLLERADAAIATSRQLRAEQAATIRNSMDWLTLFHGRLKAERDSLRKKPSLP
jgi:hypothetical protein